MSYYWVGDKPIEQLVFVPTRRGENLGNILGNAITGISAVLVKPNGLTALVDDAVEWDDGGVVITFPAGESWFTVPGLYQLRVTLKDDDSRQERLDAIQLVVQDDDGWHTLPSARSEWTDAPVQDERLWPLLELAKQQVLAFAVELDDLARPPLAYRHGQLLQARNLFNAGRVDPSSGDAGSDGFTLTPFPLDWTVKQLLRPKSARPVAL